MRQRYFVGDDGHSLFYSDGEATHFIESISNVPVNKFEGWCESDSKVCRCRGKIWVKMKNSQDDYERMTIQEANERLDEGECDGVANT